MEPRLPTPNFRSEQSPVGYGGGMERAPLTATPENNVGQNAEQLERRSETPSATPAAVLPILPAPVMLPNPIVAPANDVTPQSTLSDAPLVANDDDLIEKEWVTKAKKIIIQTKDDPYRREHEVGELQADYLRKRYGRELGASQ